MSFLQEERVRIPLYNSQSVHLEFTLPDGPAGVSKWNEMLKPPSIDVTSINIRAYV